MFFSRVSYAFMPFLVGFYRFLRVPFGAVCRREVLQASGRGLSFVLRFLGRFRLFVMSDAATTRYFARFEVFPMCGQESAGVF